MICRTCIRRASVLSARQITPAQPLTRATITPAATRSFSTTLTIRNASPTSPAAAPATESASSSTTPDLTPLTPASAGTAATDAAAAKPLSSCAAGTVLSGLNIFKGKTDPVALPDEAYPSWLWTCLEAQTKDDTSADADAADEFSKSRKQRRLALKRQRLHEARLLASGDLEALAPKIPLQKQTINLPAAEPGNLQQAIEAVDKREELRKAMRRERRAKIKETNFLKAM